MADYYTGHWREFTYTRVTGNFKITETKKFASLTELTAYWARLGWRLSLITWKTNDEN